MEFNIKLVFMIYILICTSNLMAKKLKPVIHKVSVTGLKEVEFQEGDNPCKVIKKYCKSIKSQVSVDSCFSQLHPLILQQLTSSWTKFVSKLKLDASFFIDCNPLVIPDKFSASDAYSPGIGHIDENDIQNHNRSAIVYEMLMLLDQAMHRDASALNTFNTKRNELKLSDLEKLELYRQAIIMLPNNLFIVDQFGLALLFLDMEDLARKLWSNAVARGLWGNPLQRPVSRYVEELTSKPWYDTKNIPFIDKLQRGYSDIKSELLLNLKERLYLFTGEMENLHVGGEWTELRLKSSGYGFTDHTKFFPKTMKHLKNCGQEFTSIKLSAIQPGTHIRTHTGPSNERLRLHLALIHSGGARIRVGTEWHTWEEGKVIMFDDSWEHEVIHTGHDMRVVLIMDIWHPELPAEKRIVH